MPSQCECGCGDLANNRFVAGHQNRRHMRTDVPFYIVDQNGCWIWQGSKTHDGYGLMWIPELKTMALAGRTFYERMHGPLGDRLQVDHLCRVVSCVNPGHLEAVTPAENYRRSSRVVLTSGIVQQIRQAYAAGGITQVQLAARFGIGQSHVSQIVRGTIWA